MLYQPIRTPDDHLQLQEDLNTLTKWASDWKMTFNISKCKIIQFITHHNKSKHLYTMSETPLEVVEEQDYLGVRLHHKLSWSPHVNHICNKANRMLGFLNRNLFHAPQNIREYAYKNLCYHRLIIVVQSGILILKMIYQSLRCCNTGLHVLL